MIHSLTTMTSDPTPYGGERRGGAPFTLHLVNHITFVVAVIPLAYLNTRAGPCRDFERHRALAKFTIAGLVCTWR